MASDKDFSLRQRPIAIGSICDYEFLLKNFSATMTQAEYERAAASPRFSYSSQIPGLVNVAQPYVMEATKELQNSGDWFHYQSVQDARDFSVCLGHASLFADAIARRLKTTFSLRLTNNPTEMNNWWINGSVDMIGSLITLSNNNHVMVSQPVRISQHMIWISKTHFNASSTNSYADLLQIFRPYHWYTWLLFLVGLLLVSTVLSVALTWRKTQKRFTVSTSSSSPRLVPCCASSSSSSNFRQQFAYSVEIVIRLLLVQDTPAWVADASKSIQATVLLLFWGVFCVIFVGVYSPEVYTTMLVKHSTKPVAPFDDFQGMETAGFRLTPLNSRSANSFKHDTDRLVAEMHISDARALKNVISPQNEWVQNNSDFAARKLELLVSLDVSEVLCDCVHLEFSYKLPSSSTKLTLPKSYHGPIIRIRQERARNNNSNDTADYDSTEALLQKTANSNFYQAIYRQDARVHETGLWNARTKRAVMIDDFELFADKYCT